MMDDESMEIVDDDLSSEATEMSTAASRDDFTDESAPEPRKRFQKESIFLKLLPYYDSLQVESDEMLDKIIRNISKAVLCKDFQVGGVLYTKGLWT